MKAAHQSALLAIIGVAGALLLGKRFLPAQQEVVSNRVPFSATPSHRGSRTSGTPLGQPDEADRRAALVSAQGIAAAEERSAASLTILRAWISENPREALVWYGEQPGGELLSLQARHLLTEALVISGPSLGLQWMRETLSESAFKELATSFFPAWARTDPVAAANAMLAPDVSDLSSTVIAAWAAKDFPGAIDWLRSWPEGPSKVSALQEAEKAHALQNVQGKWAVVDPNAASDWAAGLVSGAAKEAVTEALAKIWARRSPEEAAEYVGALPLGSIQNRAASSVVTAWVESEPAKAAQWARGLSQEAPKAAAFESLIGQWARQDASAAGKWLQQLPAGYSRDLAVATFSAIIGPDYPEVASRWRETIRDANLRPSLEDH